MIKSKTFKVTAPNTSTAGAAFAGAGNNSISAADARFSRATRIVKLSIPGDKFRKGGKIVYENGISQPKFFDYVVLLFAYSNYSTLQDVYYVGRLNDYVRTIYYKDA